MKGLQLIFEKHASGQDLTPKEQSRLNTYLAYLRDKEELNKAIPYTQEEKEMLTIYV